MRKKRLLVIDGNALVHRAFHALPPLKTRGGELVNGVYGFFLILLKTIKELKPNFIAATFDLPGKTFRHKEYKEYKAKRPKAPKEIYLQVAKVKEVLKVFGTPVYEKSGFEADDVIGTIVKKVKGLSQKEGTEQVESVILTGDFDTLQLIGKNIQVYTMRRGLRETTMYDEKAVRERYEISPSQLIDFKALKGDPSDNIPGVPGIGEKTATELLKKFGSLDNIYKEIDNTKEIKDRFKRILKECQEQAYFSRSLAEIRADVPIDFNLKDCAFGDYNKEGVKKAFEAIGFYSLIKQLPESSIRGIPSKEKTGKESVLGQIERLYEEGIFSKKIYEIEKNLLPVVERMKRAGIKVEKESLLGLSSETNKKILALEEKIYDLAGLRFNINSPRQLSEVLFEKLNLPSKGLRKTPGGEISTAWPELKKIREESQIIDLIGDYREVFKLKSSFLDPLPSFVKEDGRIHPEFHQLGTETGRFSCSEPNLQNVPIRGELGRAIRKCFVAKEGYGLVSFDYSQMELRIAAVLARDQRMINFFKEGKDIHKATAAEIFGVSGDDVTKRMREVAKRLNFGVLYGMGPRSFAETARVSFEDARSFIEKYYERFTGIADFEKECIEEARKKGFSETIFGRKRMLPEIKSTDSRIRSAAERMAKNLPVQGSAADVIKLAMVEIDRTLCPYEEEAEMILQIHDELLFEIKKEKVMEVAKKIKEIMEGVVSIKISLKVTVKSGDNWGELKDLELV